MSSLYQAYIYIYKWCRHQAASPHPVVYYFSIPACSPGVLLVLSVAWQILKSSIKTFSVNIGSVRRECKKKKKRNRKPHLEEELQVLSLGVLQDVLLEVLQYGDAHVHLVVDAHDNAHGHVVADLRPVQVVPETLSQPLHAHLQTREKERKREVFRNEDFVRKQTFERVLSNVNKKIHLSFS